MYRMILIVIIGLLCAAVTGCKNIEKLGPGNELALENHENLQSNVMRQLENWQKVVDAKKAELGWDAGDQEKFDAQKKEIVDQLAIVQAWLLVIKQAIESNDIDPQFFTGLLKQLPDWIKAGKDIYDLVKKKEN
jgi:hypothetical protein